MDETHHQSVLTRILKEGHYLGPHSDQHLLYCPWEGSKKTLVSREVFESDLKANERKIESFESRFGFQHSEERKWAASQGRSVRYWLPAFEWYNQEIANWSRELGFTLVNFTPGTRSNADYMQDDDPHFITSKAIFDSILKCEESDAHGLNGFILLMHLGVGPGRTDKMSDRFGQLLDELQQRGYELVRVDELLAAPHQIEQN